MKPYRHLNARVQNLNSGHLGRIVDATAPKPKTRDVTVLYDDGHDHEWSTSDLWKHHRIVAEDYVEPVQPERERCISILAAACANADFQPVTGGWNCLRLGRDEISLSAFGLVTYEAHISLWASTTRGIRSEGLRGKGALLEALRAKVDELLPA